MKNKKNDTKKSRSFGIFSFVFSVSAVYLSKSSKCFENFVERRNVLVQTVLQTLF